MVEWSRDTSWRQGHVLGNGTVDKLGLRDSQAPEKTIVVVVSHDCDLAASPDKEPDIELIVGRIIERSDGNFTHAKTARVLHLEFTTPTGAWFVELAATKKIRVAKNDFIDHEPSPDVHLSPQGQSILQRWLAARYRRQAFPDAFEHRLNKSRADVGLSKIVKPAGEHICAIFFDVDGGNEVRRTEPDDVYELTIVLLYPSHPSGEQSEDIAISVKGQIETLFKQSFFEASNSWRDIELLDCMVMSDEALSYAQSTLLKPWRLEHLSLREDPEGPMLKE